MNTLLQLLALAAVTTVAAAEPLTTARQGPRYTDPLHGFSLHPPEGARIVRRTGAAELVQLLLPDAKGGSVPIRISVLHGKQKGEADGGLTAYRQALIDHLLTTQNFEADPAATESTPVAGRAALALAGPVGGSVFGLYRRDVWIQLELGRFLVVRTSGPLDAKTQVTDLSRGTVATIRLFDAEKERGRLEKDLARGAKALAAATPDAIRRALAQREYWLAVMRKGRMKGFVHVIESTASQDGTEGVRIIRETAWVGSDTRRTLTREESYSAFDRTLERWESFTVEVDGTVERSRHHEYGIQQDRLLMVQTVVGPQETRTHQRETPAGIYLPRTLGVVAPRLVDRTRPASWAFGQYDPATRNVEMRTLTVVGPKAVSLGGQTFEAVQITDQMGLGADPVAMLVDSAGVPLRITRPDGTILQQTTEDAIRSRFARELDMLQPVNP